MTTGDNQEIPVMLLDVGDTELAAGLSYVGASRSNHPRRYCVHPFPTEARFNRIGALTSSAKEDAKQRGELQRREAACQRLGMLARQTIVAHQVLYDWCAANCNGGRESAVSAGDSTLLVSTCNCLMCSEAAAARAGKADVEMEDCVLAMGSDDDSDEDDSDEDDSDEDGSEYASDMD